MADDSDHLYSGYDRSDYDVGPTDTTLPPFPAYRPANYLPKRPSVSTAFDVNGFTSDMSKHGGPLDPRDYYRRQSSHKKESGSGYHSTHGGAGRNTDENMIAHQTLPRASPAFSSPFTSRYGNRYDSRSTLSPSSEKSSIAGARSNIPTARNRQTSLQELVNRFNQIPDEVPPLPKKPVSITSSPVTSNGPKPFRSRQSADSTKYSYIPSARQPVSGIEHGKKSPASPRRRKTPVETGTSASEGAMAQRRPPTIASNAFASQSMTDLQPKSATMFRRPLFGEVLAATMTPHNPGYGIQGTQRRRGSEGSMHTPNPMFADERGDLESKVSPSSPSAWYLGVTPSLDGINLDKPVPARPPGMHHRSRSDFSGTHTHGTLASAAGKSITIMSPTQEAPSPVISPPSNPPSNRNSQSRIPVSTRRASVASDSGNSSSSRPPSIVGQYSGLRKPAANAFSALANSKSAAPPQSSDTQNKASSRAFRRGNLSPLRYTPGAGPLLTAYISETQPTKSPPLRSSRPRQPVSSASSAASRSRVTERLGSANIQGTSKPRDRRSKNLPELANVDYAAIRQQIERSFTRTVKEVEEHKAVEAEKKRMSMIHDARTQNATMDIAQDTTDESRPNVIEEQEDKVEDNALAALSTEAHQDITTENKDVADPDRDLMIDVNRMKDRPPLDLSQEDSPTLGIADRFLDFKYLTNGSPTPPSDSEPTSAVTAGTAETVFDHDPQEGLPNVSEDHASLLDAVTHLREPSPAGRASTIDPEDHPESKVDDSYSDKDDRESIHIMLGETLIEERAPDTHTLEAPQSEIRNEEAHNRWSADSWTSSINTRDRRSVDQEREFTMERIDEQSPVISEQIVHVAVSTAADTSGAPLWSPGTPTSILSGHTTLDSDSYGTISRVLDSYHDPSIMGAESIQDLEQRILAQSPNLARAGGWDPKKVTQLYLQSIGRAPYFQAAAVPEPLKLPGKAFGDTMPTVKCESPDETPEMQDNNTLELEGENDCYKDHDNGYETQAMPPRSSLEVGGMENPQRASLNHPNDFADTSPSLLDWFNRQKIEKPLPIPKNGSLEVHERMESLRPRTPEVMTEERTSPPRIPRLDVGTPVLGINIESPLGGGSRTGTPFATMIRENASTPPATLPSTSSSSTSGLPGAELNGYTKPLPYPMSSETRSPQKKRSSEISEQPSIIKPPPVPTGYDSLFADLPAAQSTTPNEHKRLTRRRHIMKELIDTEYSFEQDMKVVTDIYKGTAGMLNSADDMKVLFGNSDQVVSFTTAFLDALKQAVKSVYVLPKEKRWRSKRDSEATTNSTNTGDESSIMELNDEDKDRQTSVGEAFNAYMPQMEKVYGEYLRNYDNASARLIALQKKDNVKIWLNECHTYAKDLTHAWNLDALLVKPVQRMLKYPLLLKELVEVTPDNHPDFLHLDTVSREIVGMSRRINDLKKRIDIVGGLTGSAAKKRKDLDGRLGLKAFTRRTEKLKQQVGINDIPQDEAYDNIAEKFGMHFFQVQVVMRDIEMYTTDVQTFVHRFNDFVLAIEANMDVGQTTYPEVESKWRKFRMTMREILHTALTDHVANVRKICVAPLSTLLKIYEGPQKLMDKRKKKALDFAKFKAIQEKGDKPPDKKTVEAAEVFTALNETLKDDLPKLFSLTGRLVHACLDNFVQLQLQWNKIWRRKLGQVIDNPAVPQGFDDYYIAFRGDFEIAESQVLTLGICNGAVLADAVNFLGPINSFSGENSPRRPSANTIDSRTRGYSNSNGSPMLPQPDFGDLSTESFGLPGFGGATSHQGGTGRRVRASSNASGRSPKTPDVSSGWRNFSNSTTPVNSHTTRPSTSTGRSMDTPSLPRLSVDANGHYRMSAESHNESRRDSGSTPYTSSRDLQARPSSPRRRVSGIFSSAMPLSDSPREQSPSDTAAGTKSYNVLFLAASVYEFNIDRARQEAGYPYLTYVAGEIFDVIGEKGELWLAKNQDDTTNTIGWIWNKHFAKLAG